MVRKFVGSFTSAVVAAATLVALAPGSPAAAAIPADQLGVTAATAAGSCWEIKQVNASAPSGAYWLLTPRMAEPQQFYCDMTTDGGGWVLVGKGRDGWTDLYEGKGSAAQLLSPNTTPMSSTTHQLHSRTIDDLLNGGRVDALSDGIRLRRATDTAGNNWQEVRMRPSSRDRWVWTFGAEHRLQSYSFDGSLGGSVLSTSFGLDNALRRVHNTPTASNGYRMGFAFGSQTAGSPSSTSFVWSQSTSTGYALPYTMVYLRPQITSSHSGFTAIPDSGTSEVARRALPRATAIPNTWGVSGTAGSTQIEASVEVQAFTQSGNRMYVGGNFRYVQRDAAGTGQVEQPFLAAFDVDTGEWIPSFRPVLNEQVRALATLPSGEVVAGGDFTVANGQPATAIVALDPVTGATSSTWSVRIENRISGEVLKVRTLDVANGQVYIGGNLSHFAGGTSSTFRYMRMLGRVSAVNGLPASGWNPNLNGVVMSVDALDDGSRVYAAGYFTTSNGQSARNAVALSNAAGAPLVAPSWSPSWSHSKSYQQAIEAVDGSVFVGGSEHSLFQFSESNFARTNGMIAKRNGDVQSIDTDPQRDVVYAGCHCANWSYQKAYTWPTLSSGWTQADALQWFGAWDSVSGERLPDFVPTFKMRLNRGIWALKVDSNGTVWAGGDILTVRTPAQQAAFAGGFARFPQSDATPPPAPTNLRVLSSTPTTVTLAWNTVTDVGGGVRYQVLRDDRTIGFTTGNTGTLTVPKGGDGRFFVRAVDAAGNLSASTPVLVVSANNAAPTAAFSATADRLAVAFDASTSSDPDGSITSYSWDFGDGSSASGVQANRTYAGPGTYTVTLTVTDDGGMSRSTSQQVGVTLPSNETTVVDYGSSWRWRYEDSAPPAGWNAVGFDASAWASSNAVLGFGGPVSTDIDSFASTTERPRAAYFTRTFDVPDASAATRLVVSTVADDGIVLYVNGVEVTRSNMPSGTVTHQTYASSARRTNVATSAPVVVEVPVGLLVDGTNVISASTHLNYRGTTDVSFDLRATLTGG